MAVAEDSSTDGQARTTPPHQCLIIPIFVLPSQFAEQTEI